MISRAATQGGAFDRYLAERQLEFAAAQEPNWVGAIGLFVGAAIATFLLSRLSLWLTRDWRGGARIFFAHLLAFLVVVLLAGMGSANGGAFAPVAAAQIYILPQALWLCVDAVRDLRPAKETRT